jgi:hypothetical protein
MQATRFADTFNARVVTLTPSLLPFTETVAP